MKWIKRIFFGILLLVALFFFTQFISYRYGVRELKKRLPGESMIIETDAGAMEYLIQGDTGTYILMLHGTPGSYRTWMIQPLLDAGFRVLSPSRPGYFRTPLSTGKEIDDQAVAYAALLDALDIDSVAVIGFSGGGPSAIEFAIRYPNLTSHLIIMASVGESFSPQEPPLLQRIMQSTEFGSWLMMSALGGNFESDERAEEGLAYVRSTIFPIEHTETGRLNDMRCFNNYQGSALEKITCPTLIIHGTEDEIIPYSQGEILVDRIPNATLIAEKDKNHFQVVFFEFDQNLQRASDFIQSN